MVVSAVSIAVAVVVVLGAKGVMSAADLTDEVDVELDRCSSRQITGTLVNTSDDTVDVSIRYELLAASGTRVGDGLVVERDVAAGQRVAWSGPVFTDSFRSCEIKVDRVVRS